MDNDQILSSIKRSIIVSCQARKGSPLRDSGIMAAMAKAAEAGGAKGIRADGPEDIRSIKERVSLPVIGINKRRDLTDTVYITPTLKSATKVIEAGAEILAMDGTPRNRPGDKNLREIIEVVKQETGILIMADIATYKDGLYALEAGADILATTLSGYTEETSSRSNGPDLELVKKLAKEVEVPVIAEGRFRRPNQVTRALELGAHAVVIGTSITNPKVITGRFVEATT